MVCKHFGNIHLLGGSSHLAMPVILVFPEIDLKIHVLLAALEVAEASAVSSLKI